MKKSLLVFLCLIFLGIGLSAILLPSQEAEAHYGCVYIYGDWDPQYPSIPFFEECVTIWYCPDYVEHVYGDKWKCCGTNDVGC